ncbi:uncharacterized protein [Amphiura filiformis]|uniref:uncharacterized protein n=1 Tax=Amphiura filiformis TaxID=82378 RepID=UPI003B215BE8
MASPSAKVDFQISPTLPKTKQEVVISVSLPLNASVEDFSAHIQSPGNTVKDLKFEEIGDKKCNASFVPEFVGQYEVIVNYCNKPCANSPKTLLVAPRGELKVTITGGPKLNNPHDIAEFGTDFIITNKGNHEVIVTDRSGLLRNKFVMPTLSSSQNFEPYAIAVRNDVIVVSDLENQRVIQYNKDWVPLKQIGVEFLKRPTGVVIDSDDKIYVADHELCCIRVFDLNDHLIKTIGREGTKPGELMKPWFIAINSRRQLVVADCQNFRVQIFNSITGEVVHCFKVIFEGSDMAVRGLTVDKHDIIYITAVTNTLRPRKKVECVLAYTMDGEFIGRLGGNLSLPRGIHVMEENYEMLAYVVDGGHHCIKVLTL